jgi:hypothetical protein
MNRFFQELAGNMPLTTEMNRHYQIFPAISRFALGPGFVRLAIVVGATGP